MHGKHAYVHDRGLACARIGGVSLGRPVATCLLRHSVVTENSLSQQRRPALCRDRGFGVATGFWAVETCVCHDTGFCVATVALQCETGVCCDRLPFCHDKVGCVEVRFHVVT